MIKVEKIEVWGWEHAIRGMRNAYESWDKIDSENSFRYLHCELCDKNCVTRDMNIIHGEKYGCELPTFYIGADDLKLIKRLYKASLEQNNAHRKMLRQVFVSMDITAPDYFFKEFSTYKVGVVENSTSTMHRIHSKPLTLDDFSHDQLSGIGIGELEKIIKYLNKNREKYIETKNKDYWWQMIQILPMSYNYKRTVTMNYENVVTMIHQRSGHRLDEWNRFVEILKGLPYIQEIMEVENERDSPS